MVDSLNNLMGDSCYDSLFHSYFEIKIVANTFFSFQLSIAEFIQQVGRELSSVAVRKSLSFKRLSPRETSLNSFLILTFLHFFLVTHKRMTQFELKANVALSFF